MCGHNRLRARQNLEGCSLAVGAKFRAHFAHKKIARAAWDEIHSCSLPNFIRSMKLNCFFTHSTIGGKGTWPTRTYCNTQRHTLTHTEKKSASYFENKWHWKKLCTLASSKNVVSSLIKSKTLRTLEAEYLPVIAASWDWLSVDLPSNKFSNLDIFVPLTLMQKMDALKKSFGIVEDGHCRLKDTCADTSGWLALGFVFNIVINRNRLKIRQAQLLLVNYSVALQQPNIK